MDMHLVVVKPFGGFVRGDIITDPTKVTEVMAGEHAHAVVRVQSSPSKGG